MLFRSDIAIRADATDGVTCLDRIIQTETDWKVKQAVQSLDFKHRAVVVLYYFNEMPIKEIARVLGCTEGTAKSRLFAARKKLKDKLIMLEEGGIKHEEIKSRARHSGLYSL